MVKEFIDSLIVAFVIAMFILTFVMGNYIIPSGSMLETLQIGDRILVDKVSYLFRKPKFGEIVVFEYPLEPDKNFIKRVIGLPGDRIAIKNKKVFLNGEELVEPYIPQERLTSYIDIVDNVAEFVVPDGMYLMLGDNRDSSLDSRYWGFVSEKIIKGKAVVVYFSKEPGGSIRFERFFKMIR